MPSQEDRLAALERKVFSMELEHLYEKRQAEENTPTEQAANLKEVNHHLTILLGIASGQERDIKIIKSDVSSIKEQLDGFEQRFDSIDRRLDGFEQRFTSAESKLEQIVQILTAPPKTGE